MSELPELNDPQARAVDTTEGPLLVFAGAGSGKTRVITYRIAHLVASHHVPPYRILAVTFTNKAAREMKERLEKLLGGEVVRDLWVGTFHATCARLLRRHAEAAGLGRDFVIYDDADQRAVVNRVLKELDLDDRRYPPRMVLSRIHREKQEARGPDDMELDSYVAEHVQQVFRRYEEHLRASNAVDFEDLVGKVMHLAESEGAVGEELRGRFRHVLVDEFQDTNHVQYRLVRALASRTRNLCVVGDDDQSIYRWRGADIRNIRGFKRDFPDATVIKLEQNYRSSARIVRAALGVIRPSRDREPKELWTANADGAKVVVAATRDERDEAAYVVARVRELVAGGVSPRDVAIFYRVHAQSRVLEEAMRAESVPYQIVGGVKFFERAEVKDLLSYLRVVQNPRSDVDLLRIVNVPARGIGATTIDRLVTLSDERRISVWDAVGMADATDLGTAAKKKLAAFRELVSGLARESGDLSPRLLAERVLEATGYQKLLEAEDSAEADARLENLGELVGSIQDYEDEARAAGEAPTLAGYLERVTLASDVDQMKDTPRVAMMTVHSAKGLEFRAVLLTGMEDEVFPYKGLAPGEEDELEEERRLAYVALTRARERLWITHASTRTLFGQMRYGRPSRFLSDLPANDVEQTMTAMSGAPVARFVDRAGWGRGGSSSGDRPGSGGERPSFGGGPAWRHPQASAPARAPAPQRAPGERWIDRDECDDVPADDDGALAGLGRGARVKHARFGLGEVRRVEMAAEPLVVAFFPGWGEKKILARFLERA